MVAEYNFYQESEISLFPYVSPASSFLFGLVWEEYQWEFVILSNGNYNKQSFEKKHVLLELNGMKTEKIFLVPLRLSLSWKRALENRIPDFLFPHLLLFLETAKSWTISTLLTNPLFKVKNLKLKL